MLAGELAHIGFTATRKGITPRQIHALHSLLRNIMNVMAHHGDAVGGDRQVHAVAKELGIPVTTHPSTVRSQRAFCLAEEVRDPLPPLERNRVIVDESSVLVALPEGPEVQRSGTWSTVRYARKVGRSHIIVWPNGAVEKHSSR